MASRPRPPCEPRGPLGVILGMARRFVRPLAVLVALDVLGAGLSLLGPVPLQIAVDSVVHQERLPAWLSPVLGGGGRGILPGLVALSVAIALLTRVRIVA